MSTIENMTQLLPLHMRRRVEPLLEVVGMMKQAEHPSTLVSMVPSVVRGFVMRQGRHQPATHRSHLDCADGQ